MSASPAVDASQYDDSHETTVARETSSESETSSKSQGSPGDTVYDSGAEPISAAADKSHSASEDGVPTAEDGVVVSPERFQAQEIPETTPQTTQVTVLKQWEGIVEWVEDRSWFRARLTDLKSESGSRQQVEIDFEDVAPDDRPLIQEGAVFYWDIGRKKTRYGSVENFSEIRFRRMPAWSKRDLERAERKARELKEELFGAAPQEGPSESVDH